MTIQTKSMQRCFSLQSSRTIAASSVQGDWKLTYCRKGTFDDDCKSLLPAFLKILPAKLKLQGERIRQGQFDLAGVKIGKGLGAAREGRASMVWTRRRRLSEHGLNALGQTASDLLYRRRGIAFLVLQPMVENEQDQPPAAGVSRHGKVLWDFKSDLVRMAPAPPLRSGVGAAVALGTTAEGAHRTRPARTRRASRPRVGLRKNCHPPQDPAKRYCGHGGRRARKRKPNPDRTEAARIDQPVLKLLFHQRQAKAAARDRRSGVSRSSLSAGVGKSARGAVSCGSLVLAPLCNSEKPRGRNQTFVIAGKLHALLLIADKLERREVNGI